MNMGIQESMKKTSKMYLVLKRIFDVLSSLSALIILSPVFLIVSIMIKCEDGGKILYVQQRVGKGGKTFGIFKFRSMKENADRLEDVLTLEELEEYKVKYKLDNDRRVTKVGSFLRKTSLDELPQLLNIVKGEMSVVGPRPLLEEETLLYGNDRDKLISVKPGLTGYWQAYARNNVGYENHKRQDMELYYIDHQSVWFDIKIIFKTVGTVISRNGAK